MTTKEIGLKHRKFLDKNGLPTTKGVYRAAELGTGEIDVYEHPNKGLCCFSEDFGSSGTGVDDETDCHVPVRHTGLTFLRYLRPLD